MNSHANICKPKIKGLSPASSVSALDDDFALSARDPLLYFPRVTEEPAMVQRVVVSKAKLAIQHHV